MLSRIRQLQNLQLVFADENANFLQSLAEHTKILAKEASHGAPLAFAKKAIMEDLLRFAKEFAGIIKPWDIFRAWHAEYREKNPDRYPLLELNEDHSLTKLPGLHQPVKQSEYSQTVQELQKFLDCDFSAIGAMMYYEKADKERHTASVIENNASSTHQC